jgi:hypothetical protein
MDSKGKKRRSVVPLRRQLNDVFGVVGQGEEEGQPKMNARIDETFHKDETAHRQ